MIHETVLTFVYGILGTLLGISSPGLLLYLAILIKRNKFGLMLIKKILIKIFIAFCIIVFLFILVGVADTLLGIKKENIPEAAYAALGFGVIIGFIIGVVILIVGVVRGIKAVAQ